MKIHHFNAIYIAVPSWNREKSHEMFNNVTIKADQGTFFIIEIKRQFSDQNSLVVLTNWH